MELSYSLEGDVDWCWLLGGLVAAMPLAVLDQKWRTSRRSPLTARHIMTKTTEIGIS